MALGRSDCYGVIIRLEDSGVEFNVTSTDIIKTREGVIEVATKYPFLP